MSDLIIPGEIVEKTGLSPEELRVEIAVMLYAQERLSIGQAKSFCEMDLLAFQKELAEREVFIHYDEEDLEEDLRNLKDVGL